MNSLRGKGLAILAIVVCVAYFGYRFYVGRNRCGSAEGVYS